MGSIVSLTFRADLDGAGGSYLVPLFVPFRSHILQRDLAHEDGILVLLDVEVLQFLHDLQLVLCGIHANEQVQKRY